MDKNQDEIIAKIEALLFIYGDPISFKKLAKSLEIKESETKEMVLRLSENLKQINRGLALVLDKDKVQLVTKPEFGKLVEETMKGELREELSPASLETLSIIIYSAPISRAEIDYIRGVNSSFILRNLLIRGLIEREVDPKRLNAFVYKPSFDFLKHLGIQKVEGLPEYEQFQKLVQGLRGPEIPSSDLSQAVLEKDDQQNHNKLSYEGN